VIGGGLEDGHIQGRPDAPQASRDGETSRAASHNQDLVMGHGQPMPNGIQPMI
jgi:hypothetical protein